MCALKRKCNCFLERPKLALVSSVREKRGKEDSKQSSLPPALYTQYPLFLNTAQGIGYVLKCNSNVKNNIGYVGAN